jgi:hypothetical protein
MEVIRFIHLNRGGIIIGKSARIEPLGEMPEELEVYVRCESE